MEIPGYFFDMVHSESPDSTTCILDGSFGSFIGFLVVVLATTVFFLGAATGFLG